jgi:integrase
MATDKLTEFKFKSLRPKEKPYKAVDGGGLFVLVQPSGSRLWRMAYRFGGKQKTLYIGSADFIGIKDARAIRDEAKRCLAKGIDPSVKKHADKAAELAETQNTFKAVALEWHQNESSGWVPEHAKKVLARLENYIFPLIGETAVNMVTPLQLLAAIRSIEEANHYETAHRALQLSGRVFRYAIATGKAEYDISASLKEALKPVKHQHRATLTTPKEVGELCRAIDTYKGRHMYVRTALKLLTLTFLRSKELRSGKWSDIDLDAAEWRIPPRDMKMKEPHFVPLSRQATQLLKELKPFTGVGEYLFPGFSRKTRQISDEGLLKAIRSLGYDQETFCVHGFRAMAGTMLRELGFRDDIVEIQLAHQERNKSKAAYNYAKYISERREMMQAWADYLDKLRSSNTE